jgi:hypothetical protein
MLIVVSVGRNEVLAGTGFFSTHLPPSSGDAPRAHNFLTGGNTLECLFV